MSHYYCALHYKSEFVVYVSTREKHKLNSRKKKRTEKSVALCYLGHCCIQCDSTAEKCDAINLYVNVTEKL